MVFFWLDHSFLGKGPLAVVLETPTSLSNWTFAGGREGGRERRKGVAEGPSASAEYEAYSYGGFGYSFQSPFAVPQVGPIGKA